MDVAKYIGLFLMKNQSCFIQGLGNLELKRLPAHYDGQALHAPSTEVTLSTAGSIDDSLANFIATSEMISISKALGALRDFSLQSKAQIQAGKDISIPFIGRFTKVDDKITFVTDAKLQYAPAPIPAARLTRHVAEIPVPQYQPEPTTRRKQRTEYTPPPPPPPSAYAQQHIPGEEDEEGEDGKRINWGRVIFVISILFVIGIGGMYLYEIYKERKALSNKPVLVQPAAKPDSINLMPPIIKQPDSNKVDSVAHDTTTVVSGPDILENGSVATPPPAEKPKGRVYQYEVVLKSFYTSEKAYKELDKLKQRGYGVRLVSIDSLKYLMVMKVRTTRADTTRVLDSLSNLFNPGGVYIR